MAGIVVKGVNKPSCRNGLNTRVQLQIDSFQTDACFSFGVRSFVSAILGKMLVTAQFSNRILDHGTNMGGKLFNLYSLTDYLSISNLFLKVNLGMKYFGQ